MPYCTVNLRGKDRDIQYKILSMGPGFGWEVEWWLTDRDDIFELGYFDKAPTEEDEEAVNKAINAAEIDHSTDEP